MATNKNFEIKNGLSIAGTERINSSGAFTGGLSDDSVGSDALAANLALTGNAGVTLPSGTTSDRPGSPAAGVMRFNTTTDIMEYYNGTNWQGVVQEAPAVTSISPTTVIAGNVPVVITGTGFRSGAVVRFIGNDGTQYNSPSTILDSVTQLTATTPSSALTVANEPYDIKVVNASGFSGTLDNALDAGSTPAFGVASGSLGIVPEGGNASGFTQITATDADSQSLTISLKSGSALPSGVSMSTSGVFSGTLPITGSAVTTSFTVQVTDGTNVAERDYTITSRVYIYHQLSGSGTWSVPAGVNNAEILIVAGGASGTKSENIGGAGGGAGGIVYRSSYTFTSTDKSSGVAYAVGAGGDGVGISPLAYDGGGIAGGNSTFALSGGTITAKGGGYGGGYGGGSPYLTGFSGSYFAATAGGSGGGGSWNDLTGAASNQGTFSGWTSYGNAGGSLTGSSSNYPGSGGGGAGAVGGNGVRNTNIAGDGGVGVLFSGFTSYGQSGYFGGGGAGGKAGNPAAQGGNGGGGIGGNGQSGLYVYSGGNAVDGTGGGGGGVTGSGSYGNYNTKGGDGGNGTILLRY
jgi:fibronectin-binding autotransporter adhesin